MLSHTTQSTSAASLFYNKFLHRNWTWPNSCPLLPSVSEGERKIQNQPGILLPPHRAAFTSTLKPDSYFFTLHFPVPGAHTLKLTTWHIWSATPPCCLWSGISYRWLLLSSPSLRTPTSSRCWQTCRLERETETMRRSPLNLNNVSTKQLNSSGHRCHRDSLFHLKVAFPHRWTPPALSWTAGGGGSPSFAFQSRFPTPPAVQHCGVGSPPLGQEAKLTWQRTGGTAAMRGDGLVSGFSK